MKVEQKGEEEEECQIHAENQLSGQEVSTTEEPVRVLTPRQTRDSTVVSISSVDRIWVAASFVAPVCTRAGMDAKTRYPACP